MVEFYEMNLSNFEPRKKYDAVVEDNMKLRDRLEKESLWLEGMKKLELDRDQAKSAVKGLQERLDAIQHALKLKNASLKDELAASEAKRRETDLKYEALQKYREHDLMKSASSGRKEVRA